VSCVPGALQGLLSLVPAVACGLRESFIIPEKPERNGHGSKLMKVGSPQLRRFTTKNQQVLKSVLQK
jgi:hypothetical protein